MRFLQACTQMSFGIRSVETSRRCGGECRDSSRTLSQSALLSITKLLTTKQLSKTLCTGACEWFSFHLCCSWTECCFAFIKSNVLFPIWVRCLTPPPESWSIFISLGALRGQTFLLCFEFWAERSNETLQRPGPSVAVWIKPKCMCCWTSDMFMTWESGKENLFRCVNWPFKKFKQVVRKTFIMY